MDKAQLKISIVLNGSKDTMIQEVVLKEKDALKLYANVSKQIGFMLLGGDTNTNDTTQTIKPVFTSPNIVVPLVNTPNSGNVNPYFTNISSSEASGVVTVNNGVSHSTSTTNISCTSFEPYKPGDTLVLSDDIAPEEACESENKLPDMTCSLEEEDDRPNPFTHEMFNFKKIVGYKCPACDGYTVRSMILAEDNHTRCHWCREPITIKRVVKADVKCPNCGDTYYIYAANNTEEVKCRSCESPIDIVYTPDSRSAMSPNLVHVHKEKSHE